MTDKGGNMADKFEEKLEIELNGEQQLGFTSIQYSAGYRNGANWSRQETLKEVSEWIRAKSEEQSKEKLNGWNNHYQNECTLEILEGLKLHFGVKDE